MPETDYTDTEIKFPRLQVRLQTLNSDTYHLTVWLWRQASDESNRERIMNQKWSGTYHDAHEHIKKIAKEKGAEVGPDDITVES
jgi:predicted DsbA family dithiol-disulfide isomerase